MRKTPYKHPVGAYTRKDGKRVETYQRGKGKKPGNPNRSRNKSSKKGSFDVTLILSKGFESYPVSNGSFSDASREGLKRLEAAEIPRRVRVKRR